MILPADLKDYTSFETVRSRADMQLRYDILQASQDIFEFAGHRFDKPEYAILPEAVKLAFIKVSEYYALINSDESFIKGYKQEKIGDYSYTMGENSKVQNFSLNSLLAGHIGNNGGDGRIRFRMRSI